MWNEGAVIRWTVGVQYDAVLFANLLPTFAKPTLSLYDATSSPKELRQIVLLVSP
jgi:hypothetical protein